MTMRLRDDGCRKPKDCINVEDEEKRKIRVKTRQRNLWIAVSGGLLYAWIKK